MPITDKTFIETQFPVSLISKESYKERKANLGQTLTGLSKWWRRKPLILIRASILGMLMPASSNPQKDRDIFLKILTMDVDGLWQRRSKPIPAKTLYEWLQQNPIVPTETINARHSGRDCRNPEHRDVHLSAYASAQLSACAVAKLPSMAL
jgi:hypothetical protein